MKTERAELNRIYCPLYMRSTEILSRFASQTFQAEMGWYSGHYSKNESGEYEMDYFPIPVISVKGCCDIETGLDKISITAKLKRSDALACSFEDIKVPFEAYGVEDYLADYYTAGMTLEELRENIRGCGEKEIGFCFLFESDEDKDRLFEFVKLLRKKGFYY